MFPISQIQIPALVALVFLILEGLAIVSPFAGMFQVVPIVVSLGTVYFAWSGGFYFLAILYALGGLLACGAFFSVRLIANIPGIAVYLMILFLPRVNEGPAGDLFATLQFSYPLLLASALALVLVIIQGVRFNPPWLFLACIAVFSVVVTATFHVMLANFGWLLLQRGVSFGCGFVILVSGYLYYRAARAWKEYAGTGAQPEVAQVPVEDQKLRGELAQLVLDLEGFRKEHGYRLAWLQAAAREGGITAILEDLIRAGTITAEQRGPAPHNAGLRAPMKVGGIGSDPLELLAVSSSANMEEIKESYQRIAVFFHHDRVNQLSPEAQQVARKMAGAISRAYRALTKT